MCKYIDFAVCILILVILIEDGRNYEDFSSNLKWVMNKCLLQMGIVGLLNRINILEIFVLRQTERFSFYIHHILLNLLFSFKVFYI